MVVQVEARHRLLGRGALDLRALVPLVEGGDADHIGPHVERRLQGRLVVAAIDAVARVVVVPGPDAGVDVAGAYARYEQQVVAVAEGLDGLPVLVRGAEGEAVGGEVGVHAVEAGRQDVVLVPLLHDQRHEDAVVGRVTQAVRASGAQELRPGLRRRQVRVVDVEKRQHFARVGGEAVEGSVVSIPARVKKKKKTWRICYICFILTQFSIYL